MVSATKKNNNCLKSKTQTSLALDNGYISNIGQTYSTCERRVFPDIDGKIFFTLPSRTLISYSK